MTITHLVHRLTVRSTVEFRLERQPQGRLAVAVSVGLGLWQKQGHANLEPPSLVHCYFLLGLGGLTGVEEKTVDYYKGKQHG